MRRALFALIFAACGARTELRGGGGDASAVDASPPHDASTEDTSVPTCASGLVTLATTGAQPDELALDGGFVYWHDEAGIFRVKLAGGASELVAPSAQYFWPNLSSFAIAGGYVFYGASADEIWRAPLYSSEPSMLIGHLAQPAFAASSAFVYVWSRAMPPTQFWQFDFGGQLGPFGAVLQHSPNEATFGPAETMYLACDPDVVSVDWTQSTPKTQTLSGLTSTDIAVAGNDVYFTSNDATNGARVMHLVLPSLATKPIPDTDGAFALAQDATALYFTDGKNLRVRRIDQKTGPVTDVASTGPSLAPMDLVVDDTCVYFTSAPKGGSAGAIMAAPKH